MDLAKIKRLLAIVAASDVAEVEIEEEGLKVVVRKSAPTILMQPPAYPPYNVGVYSAAPYGEPFGAGAPAPPAGNAAAEFPSSAAPSAAKSDAGERKESELQEPVLGEQVVRAPIVGTFYRAQSPESEPFVGVGDRVVPGDVLCIIEAMKLMNEIESEVSGVVRRILVQNAEPVEYDQPLFVIEPD